jgi:ubiquinone/menaquinone biosynthesis C-methylase UbiE
MLSPALDLSGSEGTATRPDWPAWAARWEAQQNFMVLRREERFQVMLEVAAELVGAPRRVLDLACGTGSISQRGLARFPSAEFVAQDLDPLLMSIGRGTLDDAGGRLSWVTADLRRANWIEPIRPHAPFDAIVTSTALHWLTATDVLRVYADLAAVTRPGGVVLNADRLPVGAPSGRFGQATEKLRKAQVAETQQTAPAESWQEWWTAAESEPAFGGLIAERNRLFEEHPSPRDLVTAAFHLEALRMAGFTETAVVWRYLDYSIVAAIR